MCGCTKGGGVGEATRHARTHGEEKEKSSKCSYKYMFPSRHSVQTNYFASCTSTTDMWSDFTLQPDLSVRNKK